MKKHLLLLALCAIFSHTIAQDWRPIPNGYKAHFRIDTADVITHSIWVDSVGVDIEDSIFYLNRVLGICDTCSFGPHNCASCVYTPYKYQFLQSKMIQRPDSSWLFDEPDRKVIYPLARTHQSWMFDSLNQIMARVDTIFWEKVFQGMDSVKVISLSDGSQFELSQNHGILSFPDTIGNRKFNLVGLEGSYRAGEQVPGFWEIYDFQIGDILCHCEGEGDFGSASGWTTCSKNTILAKKRVGDTMIVSIYYISLFNFSSSQVDFYSSGSGFTKWKFTDSSNHIANKYPGEVATQDPFFMHPNEMVEDPRWGIGKNYGGNGSLNFKTVLIPLSGHPYFYIPDTVSWRYNIGESFFPTLGQTFYRISGGEYLKFFELEGYIRNGDTIGTIRDDDFYYVSVDPQIESLPFTLSPNPTEGIVHLQCETPKAVSLTVHNALGQRIDIRSNVLQYVATGGRQAYKLDLSDRPPGLYFIRLTDGEKSAVKRLVVR